MKFRNLPSAILLFLICNSCSTSGVTVEYQGSSPIPQVQYEARSADGSSESPAERPDSVVIFPSLPTLEGGNRALQKRIHYPDEAIQNGIEGTVTVQFIIDGKGETSDFTIVKGIEHGCDQSVIRAIRESRFKTTLPDNHSSARFLWMVTAEFRL